MDADNQQVIDLEEGAPPESGEPAGDNDSPFFDRETPVSAPEPGFVLNPPLLLALGFQVFAAVLIGLNGLKFFPFFSIFPASNTGQIFGSAAAFVLAALIQAGLVAGVAQAANLVDTAWRWVTLVPLIGAVGVDALLLFLSVTGQANLADGWQAALRSPAGGVFFLALTILNIPSLLQSAALLDQRGDEAMRRKIEEKLRLIAQQMLADADPKVQEKAVRVWSKLRVNPLRFIPLHDSVLALLMANFTDKIPPYLGEAHWAYDFDSHTFAAIPADVHEALLRYAHLLSQGDAEDDDTSLLWRLLPAEMAGLLGYNLRTLGKPRFVDITNPNRMRSLNRLIELGALGYNEARKETPIEVKKDKKPAALQPPSTVRPGSPNQVFVSSLTPAEKALFGSYLSRTVFPHVHGAQYPQDVPDMSIFEAFDLGELIGNYRYWKKQAGSFV